ncbi:hypothetical protein B0H14DRAFT_2967927, partial [Mycena olivaceomarginata]
DYADATQRHKLLRLLTKRLEASPHLAHHIRHLKSSLNIHLLRGVMGISPCCTKTQHEGHADIETKLLVQSLLCLPTIRRVVLEGWFSSISVIHTYFDDCIQGIRNLELLDIYAPDSDPDPTLASAFAHLKDCQALDKWITGPQTSTWLERWQTFRKVLSPSLQSIQYLKLLDFSGDVDWLDLDLDQDWELSGLLAVLRRLPSNSCLHTLGLLRYSTIRSYFPILASKGWLFVYFPVHTSTEITYDTA